MRVRITGKMIGACSCVLVLVACGDVANKNEHAQNEARRAVHKAISGHESESFLVKRGTDPQTLDMLVEHGDQAVTRVPRLYSVSLYGKRTSLPALLSLFWIERDSNVSAIRIVHVFADGSMSDATFELPSTEKEKMQRLFDADDLYTCNMVVAVDLVQSLEMQDKSKTKLAFVDKKGRESDRDSGAFVGSVQIVPHAQAVFVSLIDEIGHEGPLVRLGPVGARSVE